MRDVQPFMFPDAPAAPQLTPREILALPGFAEAVALYLAPRKRALITSSHQLHDYLRADALERTREVFRVLFLDKKNQLILDEVMHEGTVDHASAYPREVARRALELGASSVILAHNHPSGDPMPSEADIRETKAIVAGLKLFNIAVHDHCVVGGQGGAVASMRALGLM